MLRPSFFRPLPSVVLLAWPATARAAEDHPLAPADTTSPRATLESFVTAVDAIYADIEQPAAACPTRAVSPPDRPGRQLS